MFLSFMLHIYFREQLSKSIISVFAFVCFLFIYISVCCLSILIYTDF